MEKKRQNSGEVGCKCEVQCGGAGVVNRPDPPAQIEQIQNQQPILQEQVAAQLAGAGTSLIGASATGLSGSLYTRRRSKATPRRRLTPKAIATLATAWSGKSQATIGSMPITIG
jgi:hypothetical protein